MVKSTAVYGTVEAERNGIFTEHYDARYEFSGNGAEIYRAIIKALHWVPKGHIVVSAAEFLKNPSKYGLEGVWVEREIESR